jgi:phenylalanyl-tRNA synthetase beta chain
VSDSTKNILLEAAKFSPVLIRRTRQALGISTESSYRFERDVDSGMVVCASSRALKLIQEIAQGKPTVFLSQPKKGARIEKEIVKSVIKM